MPKLRVGALVVASVLTVAPVTFAPSAAASGPSPAFDRQAPVPVGAEPRGVALADFDADGRLDALTTNTFSSSVSISLGEGTGAFRPPRAFATGQWPHTAAIGDLDGDQQLDVVTANASDGPRSLSVLLGDGTGDLGAPADIPLSGWLRGVGLGDLDGDAVLDIIVSDASGDEVLVLLPGRLAHHRSAQPRRCLPVNLGGRVARQVLAQGVDLSRDPAKR